jgi:hypothetical protein
MKKMKETPTTEEPAATPELAALYEVTCHAIELDHLICYRTHRLTLTKAQADAINANQPDSVRFVGI